MYMYNLSTAKYIWLFYKLEYINRTTTTVYVFLHVNVILIEEKCPLIFNFWGNRDTSIGVFFRWEKDYKLIIW